MKNVPIVLKSMIAKRVANNKVANDYLPSGILKYLEKKPIDHEEIKKLFLAVQEELNQTVYNGNICTAKMSIVAAPEIGNICFNLDASTQAMKKVIEEFDLRANGKLFVERVTADSKTD